MINDQKLKTRVGELLDVLYQKRFANLQKLTLTTLINKNPYLYRAIGVDDPAEFIDQLLAARVSSSDETIFGNDFLEPLVIWSARESDQHGDTGRLVSVGAGAGQDVAIETATAYLAISVKSGKNIFNSQSTKGQSTEFDALQARLKKLNKQFRPIIGYGYGRKRPNLESPVEKLAGQAFWQLLTGEPDYYLRIARTIGVFAISHGEAYKNAFSLKKSQLLREFMLNFVSESGEVMWDAVVTFNSSENRPRALKKK
ncbi:PmeII family type II restriction endonuclease [Pseudaeromonas paramecii]|uniref:PmeII family type II restriction endonuclease n=1 Tax=Pseudaeromonas paramecii TaxID=2138166 RepID=A0ABP8QL82_9GAMM